MRTSLRVPLQNNGIVHYAAWTPLVSFAVALAVIAWLVRSRVAGLALDRPNRRSLHQAPVSRLGGIGVLAGVGAGWIALRPELPWTVWPALVLLIAVSIADDLRGVPAHVRFAIHLAAGALAAHILIGDFGLLVGMVAVLTTAWMINLYNFMDGSDGLAGGMALFGFSFYGAAAWCAGNHAFGLLNFTIAAAAAAFLYFNFHPARVFLGDVGAVPLGFLAAALGMIGWQQHDWTWWFPGLVFSPFIADATLTLARRAMRRERLWEAHHGHYYQRLVRMGWGHRNTALAEYALMFACGFAALGALAAEAEAQLAIFCVVIIVYVALAWSIDRAWLRFEKGQRR